MWAIENYETALMPRTLSDKDKENIFECNCARVYSRFKNYK